MKKNLLLSLSAILLAGALAGCGGEKEQEFNDSDLAGTYDITVWAAEKAVDLTTQQIAAFQAEHSGIVLNATVEPVGEGDAASSMLNSVEDGADVFCFAQDQLARLQQANAVQKLGTKAKKFVQTNNDGGAVKAATVAGEIYAYPITSDNGYFMYYDKTVVQESHLDSLEDIIADCVAAGKKFSFELEGSAWYTASFFFATGCVSEWTMNEAGKFTAVHDTFNSPEGLVAVKGMRKLVSSPCFNNSSKASAFGDALPSAVVVSGTWDYEEAVTQLGDKLGVTDLPSFKVDNKSYHLGSFSGNKLLGVKPTTDAKRSAVLNKLAQYLSGQQCQEARFTELAWGPSNLQAQQLDAVKNAPHLKALAEQSAYATPQGQIHGSWWDIGKAVGTGVKDSDGTDAQLQAVLDVYKEAIDGLFEMSDEERRAWTVIGAFSGYNWDTDVAMTEDPAGTWTSAAITFAAGDEFKVRQGKSWDNNFGVDGNNYKVETAGSYKVQFVYDEAANTGTITLVPAE